MNSEISSDEKKETQKILRINTRFVDFSDVLPGTDVTKSIQLTNTSIIPCSYQIQRETKEETIYTVFHLNKPNIKIEPKKKVFLKITYIPIIENETSMEFFNILDKDSNIIEELCFKGHCLGTHVKCSMHKLFFNASEDPRNRMKTFELYNFSKVPATFQIEFKDNEDTGFFSVDTTSGQIQPKKCIYITVTYNNQLRDLNYKRLTVLFYKHEPVFIDLVGGGNNEEMKAIEDPKSTFVFYPMEAASNYSAFFRDYGFSNERLPPFQLTPASFDFGRMLQESEVRKLENDISVFTLRNNMMYKIQVKWHKDPEGVFYINPRQMIVEPNKNGYFRVDFHKEKTHINQFYSRIMYAQVIWESVHAKVKKSIPPLCTDCIRINVPLPLSIQAIGTSFPESHSWISSVEVIPSKLIFPPCVPGDDSFLTFMLRSDGHLPVLFKFILPKFSKIKVKPMMGTMRYTRLFVAKLTSDDSSRVYNEKIKVEINGDSKRVIDIPFRGVSEIPTVLVGENNEIDFDAILPGCQSVREVLIRNISPFRLKVELSFEREYDISVEPQELDLLPNQKMKTKWILNGRENEEDERGINGSLRIIANNDEIVGFPYEMAVKIKSHCEYSQLCATPRYMNFGNVLWGSQKEVEFQVYNFGNSTVYYILEAIPVSSGTKHDSFNIEQARRKLASNESTTVKVSFETRTAKEEVIQIVYFVLVNELESTLKDKTPVDLFSIRYNCIMPTLKIEECVEHTMGKIFSKVNMWQFFAVDLINQYFTELQENETKTVEIHLPRYEVSDEKNYRIRFALKNISQFDLTASLSRVKLCECPKAEIFRSISFRQKVFKCIHREMLQMKLSNEFIAGDSFQFLDISMKFNSVTKEDIGYDLELPNNRHIEFCFKIHNVMASMRKLSFFDTFRHKRLRNIYIGAKDPPLQAYWIYNNTSFSSCYQVFDEELHELNKCEGFPVLSCINTKGIIPAFSAQPLLFRFHPIEIKLYEMKLRFLFGTQEGTFKVSGRGSYKNDHILISKSDSTIPRMSMHQGEFPVSLSVDYIILDSFPVWKTVERLIYMRNTSKSEMEFEWQKCSIEGIIQVTTDVPRGRIQAEETLAFLLEIRSFEHAAVMMINLNCKIIDLIQNEIHERTKEVYAENQKIVDQYFCIDDAGYHTMKNNVKIEPPAKDYYLSIAITFHTVSTLEVQDSMEIDQYFGQNPSEMITTGFHNNSESVSNKSLQKPSSVECNRFISQVMECLLMDTMKNPIFQEMLACQQTALPPYYIQFKKEKKNENDENQKADDDTLRIFSKPPTREISRVFRNLIKDSVQQIFY